MMNPGSAPLLELRGVSCVRPRSAITVASMEFSSSGFHLLTGEDGANELLLRLLGLLEVPDAGEVLVAGDNTVVLNEQSRAELRARSFGYLFSAPFLLPSLTVIENLAMPLFKSSETSPSEARSRSESLLEFVGLRGLEETRAGDLPEAQQHAAALARALITHPEILIVEGLDRHLTDADLAHYCSLLRQAITRTGVTIIATASSEWKADPDTQIFEVAEHGIRSRLPVTP